MGGVHDYYVAAKVKNRKWHRIQQVSWSSYYGVFTRETMKHLCQMMARYRVFVFVSFLFLSSVIKFDKKCANSTQRSQSPNSWAWALFLQSQKFTLQGEVIYHQVIPSFLEIAATLLFISVTIFCWFWGPKHASNRPVYFREPFLFQLRTCKQDTIRVTKHMQINKFLTVHENSFSKEPWP